MSIVKDGLDKRQAEYERRMGALALERLRLSKRIAEIDKDIAMYESAVQAGSLMAKDIEAEAVIASAKLAEVTQDE